MTHKSAWLAAAAVLALSAASTPITLPALAATATPEASSAEVVAPKFGSWGFDKTGEDRSASPGVDFFRYANGAWVDRQEIPADRTRFGNFDLLLVLSEARTRLLIEDAAAGR